MTYFLLIRKLSWDAVPDILLGVFDSESAAQDAQASYLQRYQPTDREVPTYGWLGRIRSWFLWQSEANPTGDPWYPQARSPTADDLVIQTFGMDGEPRPSEISVVSYYYYSAMGGTDREIDSLHPNRTAAQRRMEEIRIAAEHAPVSDDPPNLFSTQAVRINELLSDDPHDQPEPI